MKIKSLVCLQVLIMLASCSKPDHSVRVKNNSIATFNLLTIDPASYGNVTPNQTTGYKDLIEGNNAIKAMMQVDTVSQAYTGSVSVSGKGKHKWTMTIDKEGSVGIAEDK